MIIITIMKNLDWFLYRIGKEISFKRKPDDKEEVSGVMKINSPKQAIYMYNTLQFEYRYEFS